MKYKKIFSPKNHLLNLENEHPQLNRKYGRSFRLFVNLAKVGLYWVIDSQVGTPQAIRNRKPTPLYMYKTKNMTYLFYCL